MTLDILRPVFLLLLPVILVFTLWSSKYLMKSSRRSRTFIIVNRCIILTFLVLALSGIFIKLETKEISTLFLLDLSDSNKEFKGEGEKFINEALEMLPKKNKAGVIVFGDNSLMEQFLSKSKSLGNISSMPVSSMTNIENAVTSALSNFPQGSAKRIVLITDGEENSGSVLKLVPSLKEQNIDLKVYKVEKPEKKEVYIDSIKIPERTNIGDEFSVVVNINSNVKTAAKLSLYSGRLKKGEQKVDIEKGKNNFVFKDVQESGGFKGYRVVIEPEEDSEVKNNEFLAFTQVVEKPKVLLIEGKSKEGDELENLFKVLNMNYKKINVKEAPRSLNEMLEYKAMIVANAHIDDFNKEFVNNIEAYVKDYAGSFIVTGGEDSFALGGYKDTAFEKVLPVEMDMNGKKKIPQMSLVLVIDHSGSMSGGGGGMQKVDLAKEAATKAVDTLRNTDEIGVLAFDHTYDWVVPRKVLQDKVAVKEKIGTIAANGGTNIYPALEEAYKAQKESKATIKHIILLTDGEDEFREYDDLIKKMNDDKITLSTVSVGEDADKSLLQLLAKDGGGRSYHTDMYTDIPRIFAKEIFMSTRAYVNNREFVPKVTSAHNILAGVVDSGKMPTLLGYIGATPKDRASVLLLSDEDDPILTAWQYGLGKSVAWNSDMAGRWSSNFTKWDKNPKLWQNIINWSIENYKEDGATVNVATEGNKGKIEYVPKDPKEGLKVKGISTDEKGERQEFELTEVAPGKYAGSADLKNVGFYSLNLREEENGEVKNSQNTAIALQYSPEYKFLAENTLLEDLVSETSGTFIKFAEDVFKGELKTVPNRVDLSIFFSIVAMVLFIIDIIYRRLNINWKKLIRKPALVDKVGSAIDSKAAKARENKKASKKAVAKEKKVKEAIANNPKDNKEQSSNLERSEKEAVKLEKKKDSKDEAKTKEESANKLDTSALLKKKKDRNNF